MASQSSPIQKTPLGLQENFHQIEFATAGVTAPETRKRGILYGGTYMSTL